jgi:hypothetical protein
MWKPTSSAYSNESKHAFFVCFVGFSVPEIEGLHMVSQFSRNGYFWLNVSVYFKNVVSSCTLPAQFVFASRTWRYLYSQQKASLSISLEISVLLF